MITKYCLNKNETIRHRASTTVVRRLLDVSFFKIKRKGGKKNFFVNIIGKEEEGGGRRRKKTHRHSSLYMISFDGQIAKLLAKVLCAYKCSADVPSSQLYIRYTYIIMVAAADEVIEQAS